MAGDVADDDSALVRRLRRREQAAFRELYARYAQPTFRFLARLAGRREAAEDLHQETWLRVARHQERLWPDSDLQSWIFAIARNTFISWRRQAAAAAPAWMPSEGSGADAGAPMDPDPTCLDLERALASLPEAHREILLLVGVEGLDLARAAAVLDLRPDAARQRLSRARAALAKALEHAEQRQPTTRRGCS